MKTSITNEPTQRQYDKHFSSNKNVVAETIRHIGEGRNTEYAVRSYGHSSKNEPTKLTDHIPQHFKSRYCVKSHNKL